MRALTDDDFNAVSRSIKMKIEIYFSSSNVLTVTPDDYLIDCSWLEESSADTDNPFGAISANELSFTLYNEDGMFSPTNEEGIYYGRFKLNIMIIPYITVIDDTEEVEWLQLGEYYLADWKATITGATASVVAYDNLYNTFNKSTPRSYVETNKNIGDYILSTLESLGATATLEGDFDEVLSYAYVSGTPIEYLQELSQGALAWCMATKEGGIVVKAITQTLNTRATITDENQVITLDSEQSLITTFDGVEINYKLPQAVENIEVINVTQMTSSLGGTSTGLLSLSKGPLIMLTDISLIGTLAPNILSIDASAWDIIVNMYGTDVSTDLALTVRGITVDNVTAILSDSTDNMLTIDNIYIQNGEYGLAYKTRLDTYVQCDIPTLDVSMRGNPLLNIGDKIEVKSYKHDMTFTGLLQRAQYTYNGGLSCEAVILNQEALGGVT
ncbi:MAG: hypothetical protein R3Y58_01875 [Eubacteriales bacterium]